MRRAVGLVTIAVMLGACTPDADEVSATPAEGATFELRVESALDQDISDHQREVIEKVQRGEAIEYLDLTLLLEDLFECMDAGGVVTTLHEPQEIAPGVFMPFFTISEGEGGLPEGSSLDSGTPVADWCQYHHYTHAAGIYESQPQTTEAVDAEWDRHIPRMIECLRDEGFTIDDDVPRAEVQAAIDYVVVETGMMCDYRAWLD